ncbi:ATP-binding protein [Glaciecola siphonariae]|uniref:histidine kinase n=1 Tax=Glaciecola siphonariae TaxID=521012 RepID=A0ABV9LZP4_9ALTE
MLSSDFSALLNLLSLSCQSDYVFIYQRGSALMHLPTRVSNSKKHEQLAKLDVPALLNQSENVAALFHDHTLPFNIHTLALGQHLPDFEGCALRLVACQSTALTSPPFIIGLVHDAEVTNDSVKNVSVNNDSVNNVSVKNDPEKNKPTQNAREPSHNQAWSNDYLTPVQDIVTLLISQNQTSVKLKKSANAESLFKELLDLNKDYIYVKDSHGDVVFANQAVLQMCGQSQLKNLISADVLTRFEANNGKNVQASVKEAEAITRSKGEHEHIVSVTTPNGDELTLQTTRQRFVAQDDQFYLMVASTDVTEREVIIKDLKRSNKDLNNFAYVASHDLKAPLNVIKRLVSWVMEDCASILPRDSQENLELVMNRANRMEQLLQDLLAYSRIGREYQEAVELNVKSKVIELLSLMDLPMGFVVKCDDAVVKVPEIPFGVVLLNLMSNAIKHHDSGNAQIQIKVRSNQSANVITVLDNGPGIAVENRAKIFDLFETLKPRDEVEGSGMGLSVVKRLVEHYGGYIKVGDNRPRGTKFVVYWPFNNVARQVLSQLSD